MWKAISLVQVLKHVVEFISYDRNFTPQATKMKYWKHIVINSVPFFKTNCMLYPGTKIYIISWHQNINYILAPKYMLYPGTKIYVISWLENVCYILEPKYMLYPVIKICYILAPKYKLYPYTKIYVISGHQNMLYPGTKI